MLVESADHGVLVSVVLPTYNRGRTLDRAIRSVLSQTYRNIELIVVDDGSTDDTRAIVQAFSDPRLIYHPLERNCGASAARNAGLKLSSGKYVAFQDSDDEFLMNKLERQVAAAEGCGGDPVSVFHIKVVYGRDESRVYGPGRVCCVPQIDTSGGDPDFVRMSHRENLISPQTLLFSRSILERIGGFDELLVNSVDWDFSLRLVANSKVVFIAEPLVMTYIQDDSISRLKRNQARSQLRIVLKLRRQGGVDPRVLGHHMSRVGMALTRLRKPKSGRRLLREAVRLSPSNLRAWAKLFANIGAAKYLGRA